MKAREGFICVYLAILEKLCLQTAQIKDYAGAESCCNLQGRATKNKLLKHFCKRSDLSLNPYF
ncbi:MAG: hypothetical protein BGO54_06600 [Sphingobacteriales bacterium 46-32]|nr:MAG: hypothetical protein BGO54_06600 [Sphingobacteriales bacterium 46-32]